MSMIRRAIRDLRTDAPAAVAWRARQILGLPTPLFQQYRASFTGRRALEIGGPSAIFARRGLLPIYPLASSVDNCNFDSETLWEGSIAEGNTFRFDASKPPGRQYIAEATDLRQIASGTYDMVLSSHTIEHTANPLKALSEWRRVLRPNGMFVLVVPDKRWTFDRHRPVSSLDHLREDFSAGAGEDDATHVPEVLRMHDMPRDDGGVEYAALVDALAQNAKTRVMHHHVFDEALVAAMVTEVGFSLLSVVAVRPIHIIAIATA